MLNKALKKKTKKPFSIRRYCPGCGKILVHTKFKKRSGKRNYFICFACQEEFEENYTECEECKKEMEPRIKTFCLEKLHSGRATLVGFYNCTCGNIKKVISYLVQFIFSLKEEIMG